MKKFTFLIVTFIIAGLTGLTAQTKSIQKTAPLSEAQPESVGVSSERIERIDKMCREAVAEDQVPGIVSLIARNGKIVLWKAYGMADNAEGKKLKRDDIFRIASQSKAITSTAVLMLWEEGRFSLDDPISKYIPEFENARVLNTFRYSDTTWTGTPVKNKITIRHLLTHTSGIGYGDIDSDERMKMIYQKAGIVIAFTKKDVSIEENIKKLAKLPLHHQPGSEYVYSMGLDVLGYLVEIVSGMPFDEFLKTHIFDPLGMKDTYFYLPEEKANRLVSVQQEVDGKWEKYPVTFYDPEYPVEGAKTLFSGGGGLSSTAKDYAVFLQMYLNGGEYNGIRLLSRTTVRSIMENQMGNIWGEDADNYYGLTFSVLTEKGQNKGGLGSKGTFNWGGYFNTQYFADPQENMIGIIMKQTRGPVNDQTGWKFRQMVFQTIDD
ncbi:serine hydrolase [Maribellus comscasis]|uniref:Serine hydrolase n=1 Tax=Maribellus comscasis TaxID=2681766 RepID=A0A6I6JW46_9BACT|nr:serine hydrolase domain-containing protein [Maribellus comscasis]QGY43433.1 serine hydrolase [Maribellus comscasis]